MAILLQENFGHAMPILSPDPRSTQFQWQDRPLDRLQCLTKDQVSLFNRDGYCLLEKAVSDKDIARLLRDIDPVEAGTGDTVLHLEGSRHFTYKKDAMTFARNLVAKSKAVRDLITGPLFQALSHDLIGPDVRLYWDQAVYKKPGKAKVFPWHQDNGYTFTDPQAYVTCWLALTNATIDNGCPWVLPGLHHMGTMLHDNAENGLELRGSQSPDIEKTAIAVPAQAGDMVIFSSLTPHKTGANISDTTRKALIIQIMPAGLAFIGEDGSRDIKADPVLNMPILIDGRAPAPHASLSSGTQ